MSYRVDIVKIPDIRVDGGEQIKWLIGKEY
jgi:hypothetical protein